MAVSDWSDVASNNLKLGGHELNGSFGAIIAELMAQIKVAMSGNDTRVEAIEDSIGEWTDTTETTTVKAAIEALRPEAEG